MELENLRNSSQFPLELRKTETFDALISQNEDLSLRLRSTISKLQKIEKENILLQNKTQELNQNLRTQAEESLIHREKEQFLKEALQSAQASLEEQQTLRLKISEQAAQIQRFKQYQDSVRTQVKPYIEELKRFASELQARLRESEHQGRQTETELFALQKSAEKSQILAFKELSELKSRFSLTVEILESEKKSLAKENMALHELNSELQQRLERHNETLLRLDQSENLRIELNHRLSEQEQQHQLQVTQLLNAQSALKEELLDKKTVEKKLSEASAVLQTQVLSLTEECNSTLQQLNQTRKLNEMQNLELEKLKIQNQQLERINKNLSLKLSEA